MEFPRFPLEEVDLSRAGWTNSTCLRLLPHRPPFWNYTNRGFLPLEAELMGREFDNSEQY